MLSIGLLSFWLVDNEVIRDIKGVHLYSGLVISILLFAELVDINGLIVAERLLNVEFG